jgi:hypothetical protein
MTEWHFNSDVIATVDSCKRSGGHFDTFIHFGNDVSLVPESMYLSSNSGKMFHVDPKNIPAIFNEKPCFQKSGKLFLGEVIIYSISDTSLIERPKIDIFSVLLKDLLSRGQCLVLDDLLARSRR